MKLSFIILVIFIYPILAVDSISTDDIYAEYCFIEEGKRNYMKLKLSKEIKKIKPISIAETDSVKCEIDDCGFGRTETSFNISGVKQIPNLWGCASVSFRSTIKMKRDSLDSTKFHCTTEYTFDEAPMKNYSSLINIELPEEETLFSESSKSLSLKDMQKFAGKNILTEWNREVKCKPSIDTTYSGKYYIRITGECK
jgi:hypothetical protein